MFMQDKRLRHLLTGGWGTKKAGDSRGWSRGSPATMWFVGRVAEENMAFQSIGARTTCSGDWEEIATGYVGGVRNGGSRGIVQVTDLVAKNMGEGNKILGEKNGWGGPLEPITGKKLRSKSNCYSPT